MTFNSPRGTPVQVGCSTPRQPGGLAPRLKDFVPAQQTVGHVVLIFQAQVWKGRGEAKKKNKQQALTAPLSRALQASESLPPPRVEPAAWTAQAPKSFWGELPGGH